MIVQETPYQLHDGFEPSELIFDPASVGITDCEPIDLLPEIDKKYRCDQYKRLYSLVDTSVTLAGRRQRGYLAILPSRAGDNNRLVVFGLTETQPARYQCAISRCLTMKPGWEIQDVDEA